jgi:hypothetical protein
VEEIKSTAVLDNLYGQRRGNAYPVEDAVDIVELKGL